eukprot:375053-Rhodomonas_salina.2
MWRDDFGAARDARSVPEIAQRVHEKRRKRKRKRRREKKKKKGKRGRKPGMQCMRRWLRSDMSTAKQPRRSDLKAPVQSQEAPRLFRHGYVVFWCLRCCKEPSG